jgi:hypothetical protein
MVRRGIQVLLVIALVSGTAAPTLACLSMMQAGDHSCCRTIPAGKPVQKMRAAPSSSQRPAYPPDCCVNSSKPAQAVQKTGDFKRLEPALLSNREKVAIIQIKRETALPLKLRALPGDSPPSFILHHSLLI